MRGKGPGAVIARTGRVTAGSAMAEDVAGGRSPSGGSLWHSRTAQRALISALDDYALIALDDDGAVVDWNSGGLRLIGFGADEVAGRPYDRLVADAEPAPPLAVVLERARTSGETTVHRSWRTRGGDEFAARETIVALPEGGYLLIVRRVDEDDAADGAEGAALARALRQDLLNAERRASFLSEASSILVAASLNFETAIRSLARLTVTRLAEWCVIYTYNAGGRLQCSEIAHRDPRREAVLRQLRGPITDPDQSTLVGDVIRTGRPEILQGLPQGLRTALDALPGGHDQRVAQDASVLAAPLLGRGRALGALLLVTTARRRYTGDDLALVEELARRAAIAIDNARLFHEAQEANRAKADFLAIMSHELRTPLNAIMGYTDLLDAEISGPLQPSQRRQLDRIRASARHLLQLIEEVLGFARLEAGSQEVHLQRMAVGDVAAEAAAVIEPFARAKELPLHVSVETPDTRIDTDPDKLRQILVNLLSNAVKFTETGSITLEVRDDAETAAFAVRDTGIGIDAPQVERVFDPFWQVEPPNTRRAGGTGLGLSVSQRYASLLGGEITVESEPGVGSTFTLQLPLRYDPERAEAARAAGDEDAAAQLRFAASRARRAGRAADGAAPD